MPISYTGGSGPRDAYEDQRQTEAAFAEVGAMFDQEHDAYGAHTKPIENLEVTDTLETAHLQTAGSRLWDRSAGAVEAITLTGTTNNLAMADGRAIEAEIIRFSLAADRTLTGIKVDNIDLFQRKYLINPTNFVLELAHANTGSTSTYRFACPRSTAFQVRAGETCVLIYDANSNVWRVFGGGGVGPTQIIRGTGTITSGNTSVVVNFGVTVDATRTSVFLTGSSTDGGGIGFAYLGNDVTSTGFTARRVSTGDNTTFGWIAEVWG
jgi:hypothetical protein